MSLSEQARLDLMKLSKGELVDEINRCEETILEIRHDRDQERYSAEAARKETQAQKHDRNQAQRDARHYQQQRDSLIGYLESQRRDRLVSVEGATYLDQYLDRMGRNCDQF